MKAWNGYILVADIVGFSERSQKEQVRMVQHLLATHRDDPFVASRKGEPSYLNSTGDGFVYATSSEGDLELPLQFFELAIRLVQGAGRFEGAKGRPMEIRVGLHFGSLTSNIDGGEGFSVGSGINWAARICDLCAPSQVLVSEELVAEIRARIDDEALADRVFPRAEEPWFSAQVKHNRTARFRVLLDPALSKAAPPRLARGELIGRHLRQALEILGESIAVSLCRKGESVKAATKRLNPRLTVWVPNSNGVLHSLRPRVVLPPAPGAPTGPSRTAWAASGTPMGPVSAAFIGKAPVCLLDFPDPAKDPEGYEARWGGCNVPAEVVEGFSRRARSFLALPLILFEEPAGVLCVDLMDPLTGQDALALVLIDELQLRSGYFLSALLHLRAT